MTSHLLPCRFVRFEYKSFWLISSNVHWHTQKATLPSKNDEWTFNRRQKAIGDEELGTIVNLAPCLLPHPFLPRQKGWLNNHWGPPARWAANLETSVMILAVQRWIEAVTSVQETQAVWKILTFLLIEDYKLNVPETLIKICNVEMKLKLRATKRL